MHCTCASSTAILLFFLRARACVCVCVCVCACEKKKGTHRAPKSNLQHLHQMCLRFEHADPAKLMLELIKGEIREFRKTTQREREGEQVQAPMAVHLPEDPAATMAAPALVLKVLIGPLHVAFAVDTDLDVDGAERRVAELSEGMGHTECKVRLLHPCEVTTQIHLPLHKCLSTSSVDEHIRTSKFFHLRRVFFLKLGTGNLSRSLLKISRTFG